MSDTRFYSITQLGLDTDCANKRGLGEYSRMVAAVLKAEPKPIGSIEFTQILTKVGVGHFGDLTNALNELHDFGLVQGCIKTDEGQIRHAF